MRVVALRACHDFPRFLYCGCISDLDLFIVWYKPWYSKTLTDTHQTHIVQVAKRFHEGLGLPSFSCRRPSNCWASELDVFVWNKTAVDVSRQKATKQTEMWCYTLDTIALMWGKSKMHSAFGVFFFGYGFRTGDIYVWKGEMYFWPTTALSDTPYVSEMERELDYPPKWSILCGRRMTYGSMIWIRVNLGLIWEWAKAMGSNKRDKQ